MLAIVNVSPRWGIGNKNQLLVHIHADMRRFRTLTTNHTIIIGRKTLRTFPDGKPLKYRENVILSRDPSLHVEGAVVCRDLLTLRDAISGKDPDSVFVCGGESVYQLLLPYCSKTLVTMSEIEGEADRFFPNLNLLPNWILTDVGPFEREGETAYRFLTYTNTDIKKL